MVDRAVKAILYGFFGTLLAIVLAGSVLAAYATWVRAEHGEEAFEFIQHQIAAQKPGPPVQPPK